MERRHQVPNEFLPAAELEKPSAGGQKMIQIWIKNDPGVDKRCPIFEGFGAQGAAVDPKPQMDKLGCNSQGPDHFQWSDEASIPASRA
jgi:hypothetical protein